MCIRDSYPPIHVGNRIVKDDAVITGYELKAGTRLMASIYPVSYTHLRAHETVLDLVCRLLLEKKKNKKRTATDQKLT